jgi:hypothetical protein
MGTGLRVAGNKKQVVSIQYSVVRIQNCDVIANERSERGNPFRLCHPGKGFSLTQDPAKRFYHPCSDRSRPVTTGKRGNWREIASSPPTLTLQKDS